MGEYAKYALQNFIRGGWSWAQTPRTKRNPTHICPDCQKPIIDWMGLKHHAKVKHGRKINGWTDAAPFLIKEQG